MQELEISELDISKKKLNIDGPGFLLWEAVVVLKELTLIVSTLGGCGGLERTDFYQFLHWKGVVVLKELISNSF